LEGETLDRAELERIVSAIHRTRTAEAHLAFDGPRFSVLFDEAPLEGDRFEFARLADLVAEIQNLVDGARRPHKVESTLRCTAVYVDHVRETLFKPVAGEIRAISRSRELRAEDQRTFAASDDRLALLRGRRGATLILALALLAGLVVWQGGIADYVLAPTAEEIRSDRGPFEGLLDLSIEKRWPGYVVTLRPGADYPSSPSESAALEAAATTNLRLAAIRAVSEGSEIQVRILSDRGKGGGQPSEGQFQGPTSSGDAKKLVPGARDGILLWAGGCSLRGLLTGDDRVVTTLRGHRSATTVDLSLD